jgi:hypothetical protein
MRRIAFVLMAALCAALAGGTGAHASWTQVGDGNGVSVSVLESSPARIALEFNVSGFEREDVTIDGRACARIRLPGEAISLDEGMPELPLIARSVIIPDTRLMNLRVISSDYVDLPGIVPVPSKGNLLRTVNPDDVPYVFGPAYAGAGWLPAELATQREPYILRDFRGTTVVVNPIQYSPATRTLRVYTRVQVELVDGGPGGANVLVRTAPLTAFSESFQEIYANHFLNFGSGERYTMVPEVGLMLVICYDDFASAMQPFVDWKNQMGLPTAMVLKSQVGTTSAQFKTYIQNYYNSHTSPQLAFVLLVGDGSQIPTPSSDGGSADPVYSKVVGTDYYPDILVGRFSAENVGQVQTQVLRTVDYERNPALAGTAWYPKGTGIGSDQGPGDDGEYDYQHIERIRGELLQYGYTQVDQIYDPGASAAMVTAALNDGRTVLNYCGHGSLTSWGTTGFSNSHVNALQNDHKLPFILSVACQNGMFDGYTCFAEAWLRANRSGVPTGAIGFYGSSINQSWNPPMAAEDEFDRLLVNDAARTYGALCYNGSCQMIQEYGGGGASMFNTWHVFGDPSVRVRTKVPSNLAVSAPDQIAPDATTFELDVPGVADALCALSYQSQFLGSAFTDGSGHAVITITGSLPEGQSIDLVVTGYNRNPYFGTVLVQVPAIPSIILDPTEVEVVVPLNNWMLDTLRVSNQGEPGSVLNFTARFTTNPPGMPWMTVSPNAGSIPYGESMDLQLRFISAGLATGDYNGQITFSFNPNQVATVPVLMHVGDATAVPDRGGLPVALTLEPAGPNPSAGSTVLRFGLPRQAPVELGIYDAAGRTVRVLYSGPVSAGYHGMTWDGADRSGRVVNSGIYFARLRAGEETVTARLLRVR